MQGAVSNLVLSLHSLTNVSRSAELADLELDSIVQNMDSSVSVI